MIKIRYDSILSASAWVGRAGKELPDEGVTAVRVGRVSDGRMYYLFRSEKQWYINLAVGLCGVGLLHWHTYDGRYSRLREAEAALAGIVAEASNA